MSASEFQAADVSVDTRLFAPYLYVGRFARKTALVQLLVVCNQLLIETALLQFKFSLPLQ